MKWASRIVPSPPVHRLSSFLLLLAIAAGMVVPGRAGAQHAETQNVLRWQTYGTTSALGRDTRVPGGGMVSVQPRTVPGEAWSSGAGMKIPGAIPSGERVTAVFWARAARPVRLTLALQGGEPGYARFATAEVALTPTWQVVSVSGVAPHQFPAESQSLSVPLGLSRVEVNLGPVAFLRGEVDRASVARAFATFRPAEVAVDVRIQSEPRVTLAGTLHLPAGQGEGPFPLAVLIQGHGPNGRGGFPEIIKRLTADGTAALEYDKRGIGQSTGTYEEDMERLTADATAAVAAMRRRPEIDGSRIALVGQSQGGVVAPAVAAADPTIATVVTLAGSVGDGLPYLRRAIVGQMILAGWPEAKVSPAVDAAIALLQARMDGKDAAAIEALRAAVIEKFEATGFPRATAQGALAMIDVPAAWKANQLRSASDLSTLRVPVLAVFGTKDPLVVASHEAPAARAALADNPRARVVVMEGMSHWFQDGAVTGTEEEVAKLGSNLGSPRVVMLVGDWLREMLAPGSGNAKPR
ncbi:alpha/beta hydrolase [Sphingomonas desiccabilis]|uniref:Alpha/beta hydrolase n=1 Tax=Sphingomonas desiccabilis TaxID=429134 RepID=A0A4Q2IZP3_9SPHN|nr:alpha/beta hydrolase [Sphingomonas desiccabilis]MBB3909988.1 pimeloyl-ACP methyl ester carboxylesterase [Sphingomonas desiccabilis]RXZ34691.1 alpha/beta hydrolase [Sphingomonas desiccabilis]